MPSKHASSLPNTFPRPLNSLTLIKQLNLIARFPYPTIPSILLVFRPSSSIQQSKRQTHALVPLPDATDPDVGHCGFGPPYASRPSRRFTILWWRILLASFRVSENLRSSIGRSFGSAIWSQEVWEVSDLGDNRFVTRSFETFSPGRRLIGADNEYIEGTINHGKFRALCERLCLSMCFSVLVLVS